VDISTDRGTQLPLLATTEQDALVQSIVPRTRITKYGRTWHMAQYERQEGFVIGRIGFDAESSAGWDEV